MASFRLTVCTTALVLCALLAIVRVESIKVPGFSKSPKTAEEEEEEKRWQAARLAYKELFVRSSELSTEEILEKLQLLDQYRDSPKAKKTPYDVRDLMSYNEVSEEKCDDQKYVKGLRDFTKTAKKNYPALRKYMNEALSKMMEFCNFENRFKHVVELFMQQEEKKWHLIELYNRIVSDYGVRLYDWKGKFLDNQIQMNEALEQLFKVNVENGFYSVQDIPIRSYNCARDLIEACATFDSRVGASLEMTTLNPKVKQNEEILEWLRYLNVCRQVQRVNFHDAISKTLNNYFLPGLEEAWMGYRSYQESYNLV